MNRDDLNLLELFKVIDNKFSYKHICELSEEEKANYNKLLKNFKETNDSKDKNISEKEKGNSLEELSSYLINISKVFDITKNVRTVTNELDIFVELNSIGKILFANGLLPRNLDNFICECKNYNKKIGVTYTGKFCSLLQTNNIKLGILFSYHGVTGKGWADSCGLIKKFYLSREKLEDRFCIINFSIDNFEEIANGFNFLQIIDNKLKALRLDTDYRNLLSKHPLET